MYIDEIFAKTIEKLTEYHRLYETHTYDELKNMDLPINPVSTAYADFITDRMSINYNKYDGNLSTIWSILINETGRFVEDYASDLLITIDAIKRDMSNGERITEPQTYIFALRQSGVDSNSYYENNLKENVAPQHYYRKAFAVVLMPYTAFTDRNYYKDRIAIDLIDITRDIYSHRKFVNEKEGKPWWQ